MSRGVDRIGYLLDYCSANSFRMDSYGAHNDIAYVILFNRAKRISYWDKNVTKCDVSAYVRMLAEAAVSDLTLPCRQNYDMAMDVVCGMIADATDKFYPRLRVHYAPAPDLRFPD